MERCYPVTETIITSENSCSHKWKLLKTIGTDGTYGEIWSSCCAADCNHVMKYLPYDDGERINNRYDIINEMKIQNACAQLGLCPSIQDAWLCETGGAFVMKLYKMTVRELLLLFNFEGKQKILANVIVLMDKLHNHGIYHGDLHLDNIMVDIINNNIEKNYNDDNFKYYFIDFGKGGQFNDINDPHIKDDYVDVSSHVQDLIDEYPDQDFDKLYEVIKIYMKKFD